jgi:hypothetical protein
MDLHVLLAALSQKYIHFSEAYMLLYISPFSLFLQTSHFPQRKQNPRALLFKHPAMDTNPQNRIQQQSKQPPTLPPEIWRMILREAIIDEPRYAWLTLRKVSTGFHEEIDSLFLSDYISEIQLGGLSILQADADDDRPLVTVRLCHHSTSADRNTVFLKVGRLEREMLSTRIATLVTAKDISRLDCESLYMRLPFSAYMFGGTYVRVRVSIPTPYGGGRIRRTEVRNGVVVVEVDWRRLLGSYFRCLTVPNRSFVCSCGTDDLNRWRRTCT